MPTITVQRGSGVGATIAVNYLDLTAQAVAPTPATGRMYFSTDGQVYICKDGATWSIVA